METLRDLYRDNGHDGCNERDVLTREAAYDPNWNPHYCIYGWPHVVSPSDPTRCIRCWADKLAR